MDRKEKESDASFQQRLDRWIAERDEKRDVLKHELQESDKLATEECTFQPKLISKQLTLKSKSNDFFQRQILWQKQKTERIQQLRENTLDPELVECTFKPSITSKASTVESTLKKTMSSPSKASPQIDPQKRRAASFQKHLERKKRARELHQQRNDVPHCTGKKFTGRRTKIKEFDLATESRLGRSLVASPPNNRLLGTPGAPSSKTVSRLAVSRKMNNFTQLGMSSIRSSRPVVVAEKSRESRGNKAATLPGFPGHAYRLYAKEVSSNLGLPVAPPPVPVPVAETPVRGEETPVKPQDRVKLFETPVQQDAPVAPVTSRAAPPSPDLTAPPPPPPSEPVEMEPDVPALSKREVFTPSIPPPPPPQLEEEEEEEEEQEVEEEEGEEEEEEERETVDLSALRAELAELRKQLEFEASKEADMSFDDDG